MNFETISSTDACAYDGAGRLTHHVVNGQPRTFSYDFTGRMTSLTDIDGSVFAYEFDGEGNRLSQSLNDCLSKRFVYDGADVLLELNPTNGVAYAWVNGPGIDQPIERLLFIDGTPRARRVFHADALGSIAALTDPDGLVTQSYAYAAFGALRSSTGTDLNRVTYTAREQLGDSQGWMYYRARIYAVSSGRFTTPDPWIFVDGANVWRYVNDMPTSKTNPFGLWTREECYKWYDDCCKRCRRIPNVNRCERALCWEKCADEQALCIREATDMTVSPIGALAGLLFVVSVIAAMAWKAAPFVLFAI